ncbi:Tryptophan--tRNA ligase, mitochondrial [Cryptotrichosporon argae]
MLSSTSILGTNTGAGRAKRRFDEAIFSGIQPTGTPHLGNYLGLFLPFLALQSASPAHVPLYLSVVGLHAITVPQRAVQLAADRRAMLAALLAAGVDPARTTLYHQEDVSEHAELAWVLNTLTGVGRLQRMTTWKAKLETIRASSSPDELRLGLLAYPVLQAADILLYKATVVPVGEDQAQHLELTRDVADAFNRAYGDVFPLPETRVVPQARVLSLRDPSSKMSKSAPNPASRISITDAPSMIRQKLRGAVTDSLPGVSYDPVTRPGVANLLSIWSALDGREPGALAAEAEGWGMGRLKDAVADVVVAALEGVRSEYERISKDDAYLSAVAAQGRARAREKAAETMDEVRRVVGLAEI